MARQFDRQMSELPNLRCPFKSVYPIGYTGDGGYILKPSKIWGNGKFSGF